MTIEKNTAAFLEKLNTEVAIKTRPIPTPGHDEVVVRNYAVASNPVDWKMQESGLFIKKYPVILGIDVCGIVHAIGEKVTRFSVGDRVLGQTGMPTVADSTLDHGAWQTYTSVKEILTAKIPAKMEFVDGAVLPLALGTSVDALFGNLGVARPPISVDGKEGILVWGGASSVGTAAIQILKICGYKVFATASPANHEYLKSLGAYQVFNYRDEDVVSKIVDSANKACLPLNLAFDTITEATTVTKSSEVLLASGGKGGKLCLVLPWPEKVQKPEAIEILNAIAPRLSGDRAELGAWFFNDWLQGALEKGEIVAAPKPEIVEGGIEATQKVYDMHKAGVSNRKLVVKVA